ncbi:DUF4747 family protein [Methylobacterium sp. WL122]|nr:DUF4747 family protein [Methylobacterium sp. WL122]
MAILEYHALNVSAHPHVKGIYRELFERVAGRPINYFGEKTAAITKPSASSNGVFWGSIYSWTEIDPNERIIDTLLMQEPDEEQKAKISIPANTGFHWQRFNYVFREKDHILVFESRNDEGRTLAPSSAERLFRALFDEKTLGALRFELTKPAYVEVDLLVDSSALEKIYAIKNLRKLEILVSVPNSDDNTEDADAIIERLEKIRASRQLTVYTASSAHKGLKADDQIKAQGEASLRHGYSRGEGRDGEEKISISTKQYPQKQTARIDSQSTTVDTAIGVARDWLAPFPST